MSATLALGRSVRARAIDNPAVTLDRLMHTMSRDAATITAAHETTCARIMLDPGMSAVHPRRVAINVTTGAFHYGHARCHAKKEAAIVATTTVRAISTTIAAIEGHKSASNEHHVKATAVPSAKPHVISKLRGESRLLAKA